MSFCSSWSMYYSWKNVYIYFFLAAVSSREFHQHWSGQRTNRMYRMRIWRSRQGIQEDSSQLKLLNFQICRRDRGDAWGGERPYQHTSVCVCVRERKKERGRMIWTEQIDTVWERRKSVFVLFGLFIRLMSPGESWEFHTVCVVQNVWSESWYGTQGNKSGEGFPRTLKCRNCL